MQVERENAFLANDILQEFAPISGRTNQTFQKFLKVSDAFSEIIAMGETLPYDDKIKLMKMTELFTEYINDRVIDQQNINNFFNYLSNKTELLIERYRIAAEGE